MKARDYDLILESLERAISVFEAQPARRERDEQTYHRLKEIKARVEEARRKAHKAET